MRHFLRSCALIASTVGLLVLQATSSYADEAALVEACDAGGVASCEDLVRLYAGGGASENPVKWVAYAEKACNLNSARACNNLGAAWSLGSKTAGLQIDLAKGSAYYEKACGLSHGLGCFNFASMHRLGEGVAIDPKLAFDNYGKACDLNEARGCTELGIMYHDGKVVTKNVLMTMTLFDKACRLGSRVACRNLEILLPRRGSRMYSISTGLIME